MSARIKGYALLPKERATPFELEPGKVGIGFDPETERALGHPTSKDVLLCFRTEDPNWMEMVCVAGIPEKCRDINHLVVNHMDDIEELLERYKEKEKL